MSLRNRVIRGPIRSRRTFHSLMIPLVGIDVGEVVMKAPAEQDALDDGVCVVRVHSVKLPQILS